MVQETSSGDLKLAECVVYSYYVLDIVHTGHLLFMKNAKALAGRNGKSIVGILTDEAVKERKKKKPILPFPERIKLAEAIEYNDCVVAQGTYLPLSNLRAIRPNIILESMSHEVKDLRAVEKCAKAIGARVIVIPYYPDQSSSRIKKKIKQNF